ncbi:Major facilitator [Trema orientale]|uniref:Major facilitator n=1 Tax=Trema orientale TaxID=63057 RepID=A0A2P5EFB3_TREOI|nr:Major facilitator [Trema orientale]
MPTMEQRPKLFSLPVDRDQKATVFRPLSISSPHMRAFHLAWLSLFACFFSTFSIPPLTAVIRRDLNLTDADISHAGVASFVGSIFSRLAMGPACDLVGPRIASATLSLLTAPAVLAMSFLVSSPKAFIAVRFLVGFSLANFVASQFWMSSMFSGPVVGLANGVAAGWANVGSGVTQLVMPLIYSVLMESLHLPSPTAWRVSFTFPAAFQAVTAILVLTFGQDRPNPVDSEPQKSKESLNVVLFRGVKNYRGWVLALLYGFSFGAELTTDNIIAEYFYDRFGVNIEVAGMIAASFGMANLFSRPAGGLVSDELARRFGMRGRLWGLWAVQTVAGLLCVSLGRVNSLWGSILVMCGFSVSVQAASGLTFGVVPFVSKRSLGVISGMTGSGGTFGAVITQLLLFSDSKFSKQTSISLMGVMMIVCTLPITLIHFPKWGGMLCGPSYDISSTTDHYSLLE